MKVSLITTTLFSLLIHLAFMPVIQSLYPFQLGAGVWYVGAFIAGMIVKAVTK